MQNTHTQEPASIPSGSSAGGLLAPAFSWTAGHADRHDTGTQEPASIRSGGLAPAFSWTASPPENDDEYLEEQNEHDEDWEDDAEGDLEEEELEDDWDLRDDDEVIMYDEMYTDWYLYEG
jgi:hypothetical protein